MAATSMDSVRMALVAAIQKGAPLYNAGNTAGCRDEYVNTATRILGAGVAPSTVQDALSLAIAQAEAQPDPSQGAWTMRRCFDDVLEGRLEAAAAAAAVPEGATEWDVLDLSKGLPGSPRWASMDDVIMGGRSSSQLVWDSEAGCAVFQGTLTTEGNGGFASVRSEPWSGYGMFAKAKGVRLLVKGDGRTYKLSAKMDGGYDGVMYQHDFETSGSDEWCSVDLPFDKFRPNFRGQLVAGRPPLVGTQVRQLGLMVSKFSDAGGLTAGFRTGQFRLGLRGIRGFI